jgi:hypothetical protein
MGAVVDLEEALSDETFSAEAYKLDIPTLDGHGAKRINLRFSGSAKLDGTSADDVTLLRAARLGREVRLMVTGTVSTKTFALNASSEAS